MVNPYFSLSTIRSILPTPSGTFLIAFGMVWIGLAQLGHGIPIATAVALIGSGATRWATNQQGNQPAANFSRNASVPKGVVTLLNLFIYIALVCLTIAAQWDLALRHSTGRLSPLWILDHLLAFLILFHFTWKTGNYLLVDKNC